MEIIKNKNIRVLPSVLESSCKDLTYKYRLSPVLEVHSNKNLERGLLGFQYGRPPTNWNLPDKQAPDGIPVVSLDFICVPRIASGHHFSFTTSSGYKVIDSDLLYYYHGFPGGQYAELLLDRSIKNHPRLVVNRMYSFWANLRFTDYEAPGGILSNLTALTLAEGGYIPVHCAAVAKKDSAILIWAPPDTGKTTTIWKLVSESRFNFMSEDITITDGLKCFSCPFTSSGLPRGLGNQDRRSLLQMVIGTFFPTTFVKPRIVDYLSGKPLKPMANVSQIIVLSRGRRSISLLSHSQAKDLLLRLNRLEFSYLSDRLLSSMWYHFGSPNLHRFLELELSILEKLTRNCQQIVRISAMTPDDYAKQIVDIVAL